MLSAWRVKNELNSVPLVVTDNLSERMKAGLAKVSGSRGGGIGGGLSKIFSRGGG